MNRSTELSTTLEEHESAFTEICFLLEVLTASINEVVGQSMPSLAVNAGREMGKKLPVHLEDPDLDKVLAALAARLDEGFEIEFRVEGKAAQLQVGRCAIREVCENRGLEIGGDLCKMLHHYWAGMLAQLLGRPVRAGKFRAGTDCSIELKSA